MQAALWQAKEYEKQGADELCFLDINASHENRGTLYHIVSEVAEHCFMPPVGGGGDIWKTSTIFKSRGR